MPESPLRFGLTPTRKFMCALTDRLDGGDPGWCRSRFGGIIGMTGSSVCQSRRKASGEGRQDKPSNESDNSETRSCIRCSGYAGVQRISDAGCLASREPSDCVALTHPQRRRRGSGRPYSEKPNVSNDRHYEFAWVSSHRGEFTSVICFATSARTMRRV